MVRQRITQLPDSLFSTLYSRIAGRHRSAERAHAAASHLTENKTKVVIARGFHLFPFRTEKLNPATPMVLRKRKSR